VKVSAKPLGPGSRDQAVEIRFVRDFQDSDTDGMTAIMRGMAIIGVVKKSGRGCVSAWESMRYIHAM
jgi:hypothetical protein